MTTELDMLLTATFIYSDVNVCSLGVEFGSRGKHDVNDMTGE